MTKINDSILSITNAVNNDEKDIEDTLLDGVEKSPVHENQVFKFFLRLHLTLKKFIGKL